MRRTSVRVWASPAIPGSPPHCPRNQPYRHHPFGAGRWARSPGRIQATAADRCPWQPVGGLLLRCAPAGEQARTAAAGPACWNSRGPRPRPHGALRDGTAVRGTGMEPTAQSAGAAPRSCTPQRWPGVRTLRGRAQEPAGSRLLAAPRAARTGRSRCWRGLVRVLAHGHALFPGGTAGWSLRRAHRHHRRPPRRHRPRPLVGRHRLGRRADPRHPAALRLGARRAGQPRRRRAGRRRAPPPLAAGVRARRHRHPRHRRGRARPRACAACAPPSSTPGSPPTGVCCRCPEVVLAAVVYLLVTRALLWFASAPHAGGLPTVAAHRARPPGPRRRRAAGHLPADRRRRASTSRCCCRCSRCR